jgi:hypothetical protein
MSLYDALCHPFLDPTLPVISLHSSIPRVTVTHPTPLHLRSQDMALSMRTNTRYPHYLSKAEELTLSSNRKFNNGNVTQAQRNFLSDTWEPRQPLANIAPRRMVSFPTDTSQLQRNVAFNLKEAVYKPRFKGFASTTKLSSGNKLDRWYCTPPLTDDSDDTGSSSSALASRSDSGSEYGLGPLSASDLRLDSSSLVQEWQARARHKANSMVTNEIARQDMKDLENPSEMPTNKRKKIALPVSSVCSDPLPDRSVPLKKDRSLKESVSSSDYSSASTSGSVYDDTTKTPKHAAPQSLGIRTTEVQTTVAKIPLPRILDIRPLITKPTQPRDASPPDAPRTMSTERVLSMSGNLVRFSTQYLTAQTQKLLKGQVTVLPSKSLLVDLREGERRKGRKGEEVLVVSPDGEMVRLWLRFSVEMPVLPVAGRPLTPVVTTD